jgi:hypothetical protein
VSKSTGLIFIVVVALFGAAVVVLALLRNLHYDAWETNNAAAVLLFIAGLSGGWGAGFSMLSSLKRRLDAAELNDLKLIKSRWILWSRPLIGVGAASILYFFLVSGLLMGPAFPLLVPVPHDIADGQVATDPHPALLPPKDMALLIVWCFLAGFSERLVPSLLTKTEDRASGPTDSDRFKPDASGATSTSLTTNAPTARRTDS